MERCRPIEPKDLTSEQKKTYEVIQDIAGKMFGDK